MAQMTGGQAFFPTSVKDLDRIYEKIQREIAARYSLGTSRRDDAHRRRLAQGRDQAEAPRPQGRQAPHPHGLFRPLQDRGSRLAAPQASRRAFRHRYGTIWGLAPRRVVRSLFCPRHGVQVRPLQPRHRFRAARRSGARDRRARRGTEPRRQGARCCSASPARARRSRWRSASRA